MSQEAPAIVQPRPHISPSQLQSISSCGEAYRRSYIEREKIPPGIAALKGKGLHYGAQTNFTQKLETHMDLPAEQIVEASVAGFEQMMASDGLQLSKDEEGRGKSVVIGEAKDATVRLAQSHAALQAPDYQPVAVERRVVIPLPEISHDLMGVIDMIDDQERVTDFKTSSKRKSLSEAEQSVQLTFYAAAKQVLDGKPAREVRLDVLVNKKKSTERQVLNAPRTAADFQVLANRVNVMLHALKHGVFLPAPVGAWVCSPKYCGYFSTCPYVNSERIAAAAANDEEA